MQCCSNITKTILKNFFLPVQCCLEPPGQHSPKLLSVQCCPKSIETIFNRIFSMQCCQEPLGEHCTTFLPMECCRNSIKTTLNRVFTCAMLSQDYQDNIEQDFYLCNVVWRFLDNIAQSFYLCDVVPSVLRQL